MKKLAPIFTLFPATAFAHGGHAPVPEEVHGVAHAAPALAVIAILAVVGFVLLQWWKS